MSDAESRLAEAHDIAMEATMAGVPPLHYWLGSGGFMSKPIFDEASRFAETGQLDPLGVRCRGCGCSEYAACVVDGIPCHWVEFDLCSACPPPPEPCPECSQNKHGNCDGTTWDTVADESAPCPCEAAGHGEPPGYSGGAAELGYDGDG